MYDDAIARDCYTAIALIQADGFTVGGEGWTNHRGNGWCLEGALGQVVRLPFTRQMRDLPHGIDDHIMVLRSHPTVRAIIHHLSRHYCYDESLHGWSDRAREQLVIQLLKEVAAAHTIQPGERAVVHLTNPGGSKPVLDMGRLVQFLNQFGMTLSGTTAAMKKLSEAEEEREKSPA